MLVCRGFLKKHLPVLVVLRSDKGLKDGFVSAGITVRIALACKNEKGAQHGLAKDYLENAVKGFRQYKDLGEKAMAQVSEENIGPFNERRFKQHRSHREASFRKQWFPVKFSHHRVPRNCSIRTWRIKSSSTWSPRKMKWVNPIP